MRNFRGIVRGNTNGEGLGEINDVISEMKSRETTCIEALGPEISN